MRIDRLNKQYYGEEDRVLKEINLVFEPKKLTAIIGPNGSGKSTLLNIMGRLDRSYEGEVSLDERSLKIWRTEELATRLTILKQGQRTDLNISVYDFVSFGRFPYTRGRLNPEDHKAVQKALKYLNLEKIKDQSMLTLSGGQMQRAVIALIVAQDTDWILLDEPLNGLDINQEIHLMNLLRKLIEQCKKHVVMIMHDINMVSQFADNIIALKEGKTVWKPRVKVKLLWMKEE